MLTAFTQQSTDSCLFYFFGDQIKNFSASVFTILKTETYETEKFLLQAHIIGQSHFFTITDKSSEKIVAVEVLACVPLPHITSTVFHSFVQSQPFTSFFELPALGLTFTSSAEIISRVKKVKQKWNNSTASSKIFMEYSFPGVLSPKTIFSLQENKNSLVVDTLHEFEENGSITTLITTTKITL